MKQLGISEAAIPYAGGLSILTGILLLIPRTFFAGNVLNAVTILVIMALTLRAGNYRMVLLEIPFVLLPLLLIWLKYPFKHEFPLRWLPPNRHVSSPSPRSTGCSTCPGRPIRLST